MSESLTPESVTPNGNGNQAPVSPETSQPPSTAEQAEPGAADAAERATVKKLLAEARSTREVLTAFRSAIEAGTFPGSRMMEIAKGIAFLEAVINQNQAHIANLQGRN